MRIMNCVGQIKNTVSVIVPVYRTYYQIERCILSLLLQTYNSIEIVTVDDGSPDGSGELCDELALSDCRIQVHHKVNGGLSSARQSGFICSNGEFILFVDSDDYAETSMIEKLLNALYQKTADLVVCSYSVDRGNIVNCISLPYINYSLLEGREEIIEHYVKPLIGKEKHEIGIPGFLWIRLHQRSLIQNYFFASERIYYLEDHVFDLLYADSISSIVFVNEPLYHYCINNDSLTNCFRPNKWKMYRNLLTFYNDYISKRNISNCDSRLMNFINSAFQASVDNAVNSGSYEFFLNELKEISDTPILQKLWQRKSKISMNCFQRLILYLYHYKLYYILYKIRKWRISIIRQ